MAKNKRKELRAGQGEESPVLPMETVHELTQKRGYLRCPVCGLMAPVERTETPVSKDIIGFKGGPYEPSPREQRFGGSSPSSDGTMASRPGGMEWTKKGELDLTADQMGLLIDRLEGALGYLRALRDLQTLDK